MSYTLGAEEIERGRWLAWVFELPGCTSAGPTQEEAAATAGTQIMAFLAWMDQAGQGMGPLFASATIDVEVKEVYRASFVQEDRGNSKAFFEDDRLPLREEEVDEALQILALSRRDLFDLLDLFPPGQIDQPIPGEMRGTLANILEHLAWAEWWYYDRLNVAFNREEMPDDPRGKLEQIRAWTRARLREMVGDRTVVDNLGELWSPRKVVRRTIWHEIDHIAHIQRLLNGTVDPNGSYVEL